MGIEGGRVNTHPCPSCRGVRVFFGERGEEEEEEEEEGIRNRTFHMPLPEILMRLGKGKNIFFVERSAKNNVLGYYYGVLITLRVREKMKREKCSFVLLTDGTRVLKRVANIFFL